MRIRRIDARHLRLPPRTRCLPLADAPRVEARPIDLLWVEIVTDEGSTGSGFVIADDAPELLGAIHRVISPRLLEQMSLVHERLFGVIDALKVPTFARAYSAIDLAIWDMKGRVAGEPLWRLWGGRRDRIQVFFDVGADAPLGSDEIMVRCRDSLDQGFRAVRVAVAGQNAEAESRLLVDVRDALGDDVWIAVAVERAYDYETALPMARFLDEEIGAEWFEDPLPDDDIAGYKLLTEKTETAIALGRWLQTAGQMRAYLEAGIPLTFRPDVVRCGGLTPLLKWAATTQMHLRSLVPHAPTEIALHLACGLPNVPTIGFDPRLSDLFQNRLTPIRGEIVAPAAPGFGLEPDRAAIERFTISRVG
jgi:L-alanine-DL-glutamate epimerase-like enolase superfamily enzyme